MFGWVFHFVGLQDAITLGGGGESQLTILSILYLLSSIGLLGVNTLGCEILPRSLKFQGSVGVGHDLSWGFSRLPADGSCHEANQLPHAKHVNGHI